MLKGFRDFILRGNVMDLAVAVIIGAAFTGIVTALTEKIINPLLGAVIGKPNFGYLIGHINGGEIRYGDFFTAVVNFLSSPPSSTSSSSCQRNTSSKSSTPLQQPRSQNPAPSASATSQSKRRAASSAPSPSTPDHKPSQQNPARLLHSLYLFAAIAPSRFVCHSVAQRRNLLLLATRSQSIRP